MNRKMLLVLIVSCLFMSCLSHLALSEGGFCRLTKGKDISGAEVFDIQLQTYQLKPEEDIPLERQIKILEQRGAGLIYRPDSLNAWGITKEAITTYMEDNPNVKSELVVMMINDPRNNQFAGLIASPISSGSSKVKVMDKKSGKSLTLQMSDKTVINVRDAFLKSRVFQEGIEVPEIEVDTSFAKNLVNAIGGAFSNLGDAMSNIKLNPGMDIDNDKFKKNMAKAKKRRGG